MKLRKSAALLDLDDPLETSDESSDNSSSAVDSSSDGDGASYIALSDIVEEEEDQQLEEDGCDRDTDNQGLAEDAQNNQDREQSEVESSSMDVESGLDDHPLVRCDTARDEEDEPSPAWPAGAFNPFSLLSDDDSDAEATGGESAGGGADGGAAGSVADDEAAGSAAGAAADPGSQGRNRRRRQRQRQRRRRAREAASAAAAAVAPPPAAAATEAGARAVEGGSHGGLAEMLAMLEMPGMRVMRTMRTMRAMREQLPLLGAGGGHWRAAGQVEQPELLGFEIHNGLDEDDDEEEEEEEEEEEAVLAAAGRHQTADTSRVCGSAGQGCRESTDPWVGVEEGDVEATAECWLCYGFGRIASCCGREGGGGGSAQWSGDDGGSGGGGSGGGGGGGGVDAEDLVAPCGVCAGGLRYIHGSCLQRWLESSWALSCPNCRTPYESSRLDAMAGSDPLRTQLLAACPHHLDLRRPFPPGARLHLGYAAAGAADEVYSSWYCGGVTAAELYRHVRLHLCNTALRPGAAGAGGGGEARPAADLPPGFRIIRLELEMGGGQGQGQQWGAPEPTDPWDTDEDWEVYPGGAEELLWDEFDDYEEEEELLDLEPVRLRAFVPGEQQAVRAMGPFFHFPADPGLPPPPELPDPALPALAPHAAQRRTATLQRAAQRAQQQRQRESLLQQQRRAAGGRQQQQAGQGPPRRSGGRRR